MNDKDMVKHVETRVKILEQNDDFVRFIDRRGGDHTVPRGLIFSVQRKLDVNDSEVAMQRSCAERLGLLRS